MQRSVIWSELAKRNFENVIDYLIAEWNEKVINDFVGKTEDCIRVLISYPFIGQVSGKRKGVRKVLITKHNLLIYKISRGNIYILDIFDTRQNPKKNKY